MLASRLRPGCQSRCLQTRALSRGKYTPVTLRRVCSSNVPRLDTYKINSASYHFTTFAFLPLLAAAKTVGGAAEPGNVINLSSMSGITNTSQRGQFNYNASKWVEVSCRST